MSRTTTENFYCPQHGVIIDTNILKSEWKEKYDELINFILVNHRFPLRKKATKYETELNEYFTKEYDLYKMDEFANERLDIFQNIVSLGDSVKKANWINSVRDILIFMLIHSRRASKKSKDEYEKSIAKKTKAIEDMINNEDSKKKLESTLELNFNKIVMLFNPNRVSKEISNMEKLNYFIVLNEKEPDINSENPLEVHIADWAKKHTTQEEIKKIKNMHRKICQVLSYKLDEEIKDLQYHVSDLDTTKHLGLIGQNPEKKIEHERKIQVVKEDDEKEWTKWLNKYENFLKLMNRNPVSISKEKDEIELVRWFDRQKSAYNSKSLPESRVLKIERVLIVFNKYKTESKRQKKLRKVHKGNYEVGY